MRQAPSTSDKPMLYFVLFPFISEPVIISRLTIHCAALRTEGRRGRVLCWAALDHSLVLVGFKKMVGRCSGTNPARHAGCQAVSPLSTPRLRSL